MTQSGDIKLEATVRVGPYLGYFGEATYDAESKLFHGEVIGTRDVITFQSREIAKVNKEFKDSIDSYLAFCRTENREPNKPYSGQVLVRMPEDLHRDLATVAALRHDSLNSIIVETLEGIRKDERPSGRKVAALKERGRVNREPGGETTKASSGGEKPRVSKKSIARNGK